MGVGCGGYGCGGCGGCGSNGHGNFDSFLEHVDDKAASAFMGLSPIIQGAVLARGELTGRNPSAMLITRIKEAKSNSLLASTSGGASGSISRGHARHGGCGAMHHSGAAILSGMPYGTAVDSFIAGSNLDADATNKLWEALPEVQQAVVARGEVATARNPSATVLARIREETRRLSMNSGQMHVRGLSMVGVIPANCRESSKRRRTS